MPRIQKVLAGAGVASRRNVEEMIRQGRVALNGKIITALPILVDPEQDLIHVDGEAVELAHEQTGPRLYLLLNKPKNVYATNVAQGEQTRAVDLLPPNLPGRVYPVGRLEADTKGLLLFTNDGELTHRLTHPRFGIAKTYRAIVNGFITPQAMQTLSRNVWLSDGGAAAVGSKTGRSFVKIVKRSRDLTVLEITIREGRNGHIRRLLAKIGHKVRELTRIKMGPLTLEGLQPGKFRALTKAEIAQLKKITSRE
jgi:23S rRNA pseudouridine2605 synthase